MPPGNQHSVDADHLLPPARKSSVGPVVGVVIIVILFIFGALYFWGATLNQKNTENNLPLIPAQGANS